ITLVLLTPGPVVDWLKELLSLPVTPPKDSEFPMDKVVHCILFAGCTFVWLMDWHPRFSYLQTALLMLAYAAFTEVAQMYVPARSAEWADLGADALGIAMAIWYFWRQKKARHEGGRATRTLLSRER